MVTSDGVVGHGGEQEFPEARPAIPPSPIGDRRLAVHHVSSFVCKSIESCAVIIDQLSPRHNGLQMVRQWDSCGLQSRGHSWAPSTAIV